jgi:hypothetical protein
MLSLSWIAWLSVILIQAIVHFGFLGRKGVSRTASSKKCDEIKESSSPDCPDSVSLSTKNKVAEDCTIREPVEKFATPVDSRDTGSLKVQEEHLTTSVSRNVPVCTGVEATKELCEKRISSYGTFDTCDTMSSSCQDCSEVNATRSDARFDPTFPHAFLQEDRNMYPEDDIDDEYDSIDDEEWRLQLLKDYYYNDENGHTTDDVYLEASAGENLVDPVQGDTIQYRISETRHSALHTAIQASISVQ